MDLTKQYVNVVNYGEFINYEINPISNADLQPFLSKLTITVDTTIGDADLYVSFDFANPSMESHDYKSRQIESINQVTLVEKEDNWLNRPIFFSIYGNSKSEVRISFTYEYQAEWNEVLQKAIKLGDSTPVHQVIENEESDRFYSYLPWWTGRENRTVALLADMYFNKVFFYAEWNNYPKHFLTTMHDINDTIIIPAGDEYYHYGGGEYYIRLRPDFALYDLLTSRIYKYDMYAFSMTPAAYQNEQEKAFE